MKYTELRNVQDRITVTDLSIAKRITKEFSAILSFEEVEDADVLRASSRTGCEQLVLCPRNSSHSLWSLAKMESAVAVHTKGRA